jgi:glycosyl transferase family 4/glycosyl transferase family 1
VTTWHVITGEYPPQPGGVSDYTRQLARGLADAGDAVEIWAPPCDDEKDADGERGRESFSSDGREKDSRPRIRVHRLPDRFGFRSLRVLSHALHRAPAPRRVFLQYVPQSFGWKGANLPFCLWLRSRRRESIWVMFHEVMFRADGSEKASRQALSTIQRWMARLVAGAAERAFVSIPGWLPMLEPFMRPGATLTWLPVPSAIPVRVHPEATAAIRARYANGRPLVGHFGTYGGAISALLERTLQDLAVLSDCHVLLLGDKSDVTCRSMIVAQPALAGRLFATGHLAAQDLSHHVAACDLMLQPYPDGISSRRTSAMVALSHGRAIVTTAGWLTEPIWAEAGAAILAPVDDPHALAAAAATILFDVSQREAVGRRAAALYDARFHLRHSVAALRSLHPA